MSRLYRINLKIVENGKTLTGKRIIDVPLEKYIDHLHKTFPDASITYMELEEEWEDTSDSSTSKESVILMGWRNNVLTNYYID